MLAKELEIIMYLCKKMKWTVEQMGSFLADQFRDIILESFESDSMSWLREVIHSISKVALLKEWVIFNIFAMVTGIQAHFKGSRQGSKVADEFISSCCLEFIENGLFEKPSTFEKIFSSRYNVYSDAMKETRGLGPIYFISKAFLSICDQEGDPIATRAVAEYYTIMTIANKKLIADLINSIQPI